MAKSRRKMAPKTLLKLPDLEQSKFRTRSERMRLLLPNLDYKGTNPV
jgi:hypothetical protein